MNKRLNILHLEDEPDFAELVRTLLEQGGVEATVRRVSDRLAFLQALDAGQVDLIISDFHLPSFTGLEALTLARKKFPFTPFILVSGTIGEQAAIESLKAGATDYVLKQYPDRLPSAVQRAVHEAEERAKRRAAENELIRREKYFRTITENSLDVVAIVDREGVCAYVSPSMERVMGHAPSDLLGIVFLSGFIRRIWIPLKHYSRCCWRIPISRCGFNIVTGTRTAPGIITKPMGRTGLTIRKSREW